MLKRIYKFFLLLIINTLLTWYLQSNQLSAQTEPRVSINLNETYGSYLGFGIGIHPGDIIYGEAFDELDLEFVRMELGPLWYTLKEKIPSDTTVDQLHDYIARNYNGDASERLEGAQFSHKFLREHGIKIILIHFELPYHWRIDKKSGLIHDEYIDDLARFYTAHLLYLKGKGITIDYIELANEPDGHWNGHIPPNAYASLLEQCDSLFEEYGLGDVQILGPGLAFLNLYGRLPSYMEALQNGAHTSLDGWSTHTWDEVEFHSSNPEYSYGVWQPFLDGISKADPIRKKPLFVTEYGSDVTEYANRSYESARDQIIDNVTDSWDYAVRVIANSISHLNRGANALILYRLSNSHWHKTGWGIIQPESPTYSRKKPIYQIITDVVSDLPLNSQILKPSWYTKEDPITCSILNDTDSQELTLLTVNWTEEEQTKTLLLPRLYNIYAPDSNGYQEAGNFKIMNKLKVEEYKLSFTMPKRSIYRIQLKSKKIEQ